jgi:hypothetical protein
MLKYFEPYLAHGDAVLDTQAASAKGSGSEEVDCCM